MGDIEFTGKADPRIERAKRKAEKKADREKRQKEADEIIASQTAGLENIVRQAISASGLTPYALGKRSGISRQQMYNFVNGERGLTLASLDRLCFVLGLTLTSVAERKTGTYD